MVLMPRMFFESVGFEWEARVCQSGVSLTSVEGAFLFLPGERMCLHKFRSNILIEDRSKSRFADANEKLNRIIIIIRRRRSCIFTSGF